MKYTDEQITELKALGLNDEQIKSLEEGGVEFEAAKAMAESAEAKAKELAETQAREKAATDVEAQLVKARSEQIARDQEKAAQARKAAFQPQASQTKDANKASVEKAMKFGLDPESGGFGAPVFKDFGKDAGRLMTDAEKAGLWMVGTMVQNIKAKNYPKANEISDFVKANWLDEDVKKGLLTSSANYGGYLVPTEFLNLFVEKRYESSPYRQLVDVIPVTSMNGEFPVEVNGATVYRKAEAAAGTASRPKFGTVTYNITSKFALVVVSYELLATNVINLASWILRDFARAMALKEWAEFITGSGSGAPQGLANASITQTAAAATAPMLFTDIHLGYYALPSQYRDRAVWILRDDRLMSVENIKDSSNRPIFIPSDGTLGVFPGALKGKRVYVNNNITEDTAATPKSKIYFGDPSYYKHFELRGLSFEESTEASIVDESGATVSLFQSNQMALKAWTNDDAKLALKDAFATLTNVS